MNDDWTGERPPRCDAWNQTSKHQYSSGRCQRAGFYGIRNDPKHAGKRYCRQHHTMAVQGRSLARKFWKGDDVINFKGRDVIVWTMPDGERQPFYRSTGRNTGRKGTWFPFHGFRFGWFIKPQSIGPLDRFGLQKYKDASDLLATKVIPTGKTVTDGEQVNKFIERKKKGSE